MIITCPANTRLQDYLLTRNIHIKTACGGRGNCGKCKVRVVEGHCSINTMDRIWFTKKELVEGCCLGCQVYIVEELLVDFPE